MYYTHLEDYIYELFTSIKVMKPQDLDMHSIARKLGVTILYKKKVLRYDNEIHLNRGTKRQEWQDFGHEIGHYLRHCGCHFNMHYLFRNLQEYQATYFAYHFCVPTFMLEKLSIYSASDIMYLFNVEQDFALRRLEMYQNKKFYSEKLVFA